MDINFNIEKVYDLLTDKLVDWASATVKMLPNLVVSIIVLVIFIVAANIFKKVFKKVAHRITDNLSLRDLLASIIYIVIVTLGCFIALSILKLDGTVKSLLAGAGVIGLALGFAFQEIASNFIAGTMMSIRKPFSIGDLIETNDFLGTVRRIQLRTTQLETLQGQYVMIPNAEVFKKAIINYTQLGKRRIDIPVGVTYDTDLPFAKDVALKAVEKLQDVSNVSIYYTGFNNSSIDFVIRYWIKFSNKQTDFLEKQDEGIIAIKKAFDENDITIPFPIRTLDFGDNFMEMMSQNQNS